MAGRGIDVLLLGREGNARCVSGARRLFLAGERAFAPGCVVVRDTGAVHLLSNTDFGVPDDIPRSHLYATSWNPATLVQRVAEVAGGAQARRVGVDGMTPLFEALLEGALPNAELVDGEALMRTVRRIKSSDEIDLIRAAANVADATMAKALDAAGAGVPDATVRAVAMETMAAQGVTTAAFEPQIARSGERVAVAIGVMRDGWEADLARTVPGPARPKKLLDAIARCRPGMAVARLDATVHGGGLGYEVVRPTDVLEPGMVLSVGLNGARDTVAITERGADVLTGPSL